MKKEKDINNNSFTTRIKVTFTVYLKDAFGIYSVTDTENNMNYTIKGNTFEPLIVGRFYNIKVVEVYDSKRMRYSLNILEAYEDEPRDKFEEFCFLTSSYNKSYFKKEDAIEDMKKRVTLDKEVKKLVSLKMKYLDAKRFVKKYGQLAYNKVVENPYILLDLTTYFSFDECDEIANHLSYSLTSSIRIVAALREAIKEYCNETGDTCCPIDNAKPIAKKKLMHFLSNEELDEIIANHTEEFFDYTVFNYTNIVSLTDVKEYRKLNKPYLFCNIDDEAINDEMNSVKNIYAFEKDIKEGKDVLILSEVIKDEQDIAERIKTFNSKKTNKTDKTELDKLITRYEVKEKITLSKMQKEAIYNVLEYLNGGFYIINGPAGTGKTTIVKAVIYILSKLTKFNSYITTDLVAPTGRASDVLAKSVGLPARTIHKFLNYNTDTNDFIHNRINPIGRNLLVVDEVSMLDTWLCACLLNAINDDTKIIFLGDDRQLPSVGPGKILRDILDTYSDVVTLTEVKRQNTTSGILNNAISILHEEKLNNFNDSRIIPVKDVDKQLRYIAKGCSTLLTNVDSEDIAVLTPMKIGELGSYNINRLLQPIFNPNFNKSKIKVNESESYKIKGYLYTNKLCVGDKVINNKNMYNLNRYSDNIVEIDNTHLFAKKDIEFKKDEIETKIGIGVMNGEIGTIDDIRETDVYMTDSKGIIIGTNHVIRIVVKFPSITAKNGFDYVFYDDDSEALNLAYAITIHKSQGSSWPYTISVINDCHSRMICNELLYVAATRASKFNFFIINEEVYNKNVSHYLNDRKTFLADAIKKEFQ